MMTAKMMGAHAVLGIFEMLPETLIEIEQKRPAMLERKRAEQEFLNGEEPE